MTTTSDSMPPRETTGPAHHEIMARAVLRNGPQVLLARQLAQDFWFMPGGRVQLGERATSALARELKDELDLEPHIGDLLGVAENQYTLDGVTHHELNLVFDVRLDGRVDHSHNPDLELRWFSPDVLEDMDIRPDALADILRYGPGTARLRLLSNGLPR